MCIRGSLDGEIWLIAEEMEASCLGAGFRFTQTGCIGVCPKMHLAGHVFDRCIGMGGCIVKELVNFVLQCEKR